MSPTWKFTRNLTICLGATAVTGLVAAQSLQTVQPEDAGLGCAQIAAERSRLKAIREAGQDAPSVAQAAAGGAADLGGQVAGAAVAQSGIFGSLGGLFSKLTGAAAKQQVQERMAPSEQAKADAALATQRDAWMQRLAQARECPAEGGGEGKPLSAEAFAALSAAQAGGNGAATAAPKPAIAPLTPAVIQGLAPATLDTAAALPEFEGSLNLAGSKFFISEFLVAIEVGGKVSASTRAARFGGVSYGATNTSITYQVDSVDTVALQALVDRAWADFQERARAAGIPLASREAVIAGAEEIYPATEPGTTAQAPVYQEENLGYTVRKFLVFSPTGMKLHPRSFAGLGAGNIGARIQWTQNKWDAFSVAVALSLMDLESSGSGSSMLRDGSSVDARPQLRIQQAPGALTVTAHTQGGMLRQPKPLVVGDGFASVRQVGGFDSQQSNVVKSLQLIGALAGVAPNTSKTVELAVDLNGPKTAQLALDALARFNQALVNRMKAAL